MIVVHYMQKSVQIKNISAFVFQIIGFGSITSASESSPQGHIAIVQRSPSPLFHIASQKKTFTE